MGRRELLRLKRIQRRRLDKRVRGVALRLQVQSLTAAVFGRPPTHPHTPDSERAGFELVTHQSDDLAFVQTKLKRNGFKRRVVRPCHADDAGDIFL